MAYRTLLAHLPNAEGMDDAMDVATALAERHSAHLIGLHLVPPLVLPYAGEIPAAVTRELDGRRRSLSATLGERFEAATKAGGYVADWRVVDDTERPIRHVLNEVGGTADLIIAAEERSPALRGARSDMTARLLGSAGRPLLRVPPERRGANVGERVFVAWDGQRAATRAVFAALPILVRADAVRLQRLNAPGRDRQRALGATEVLADTLARHGVEVEHVHGDAREREVGADLVDLADGWGADLIVSGAQEQGALREFLFGSTTRHLLEHARVPLLMSA